MYQRTKMHERNKPIYIEAQTSLFDLQRLQDVWQILILVRNATSLLDCGGCTEHITSSDGSRLSGYSTLTKHQTGSLYFRVGMSVPLLRYRATLPQNGLQKFCILSVIVTSAGRNFTWLCCSHKAGDVNAAQDVPYAFPYGIVFGYFI